MIKVSYYPHGCLVVDYIVLIFILMFDLRLTCLHDMLFTNTVVLHA